MNFPDIYAELKIIGTELTTTPLMGFLLYFAAPWLLLGWVTAQLGLGRQGLDRRWLWSLYLALGIVLLGWLAISIFILANSAANINAANKHNGAHRVVVSRH